MKSKKRIFLFFLIVIFIIVLIASGLFLYMHFKPILLTASDGSFQLAIPRKVKFETRPSSNPNYTLDLYSVKDKMFFSTTTAAKTGNIDLLSAVNQERVNMAQYRSTSKDISEATKIAIKDYNAYEYTYQYYDSDFNEDVFCQIVWIETEKNIYVLDLEVVSSNRKKYEPIFDNIVASFTELK